MSWLTEDVEEVDVEMAEDDLALHLHHCGAGAWTLSIGGELDMAGAPSLRAFIDVLPPDIELLALDLSQLTFLDSTGIGALLKLERRVRGAGGTTEVHGAQRGVRRVMEITQLNRLMPILDD